MSRSKFSTVKARKGSMPMGSFIFGNAPKFGSKRRDADEAEEYLCWMEEKDDLHQLTAYVPAAALPSLLKDSHIFRANALPLESFDLDTAMDVDKRTDARPLESFDLDTVMDVDKRTDARPLESFDLDTVMDVDKVTKYSHVKDLEGGIGGLVKAPTMQSHASVLLEPADLQQLESIVERLGTTARGQLLQRVLETNNIDILAFVMKMRERLQAVGMEGPKAEDWRVGMEDPKVEVRFDDLQASAQVFTGSRSIPTVTNAAISLASCFVQPLMKLLRAERTEKKTLVLLENVSGVLKPGRLTLLLGPPGCGKSTLLRALAGQMKDETVQGSVLHNGEPIHNFVVERTAAYINQVDDHIGEMTVRETLAFSARCMGVGHKMNEFMTTMREIEKKEGIKPDADLAEFTKQIMSNKNNNLMVDLVAQLLGLDVCLDTFIGNAMAKGISGGQKKRVTTGEMTVGSLPVLMMDEISTGLDSSSTFLIVQSLKNTAHFRNTTIMIALLQPAPETYDLFDDIMLMGEGKILFHGPKEAVIPFTESQGLVCPPRKAVADFLQEITSKSDQKLYRVDQSKDAPFITCNDIVDAFAVSPEGMARKAEFNAKPEPTDMDKSYALPTWHMMTALLKREALLTNRNMAFVIIRALNIILVGTLNGTLYLNTPKTSILDANLYISVVFFSIFMVYLGGFGETPIFLSYFPVFYKQRNSTSTLPGSTAFVEPCFFLFFLIMVVTYTFSTALFRTIAAGTRDNILAQAVAAAFLVMSINTCGYTLSKALKGSGAAQLENEDGEAHLSKEKNPEKISALSHDPFTLAFRNIKCYVPKPGDTKTELQLLKGINGCFSPEKLTALMGASGAGKTTLMDKTELQLLKGINGCFSPGKLTALMGASGAGKTTLMDVLAGRKTTGRIEGDIYVNGFPKVQQTFSRVMGYVEQFDVHNRQVQKSFNCMMSAMGYVEQFDVHNGQVTGQRNKCLKGNGQSEDKVSRQRGHGHAVASHTVAERYRAEERLTGREAMDMLLPPTHSSMKVALSRRQGPGDRQEDQATVHEALLFSASLRLPDDVGEELTAKFVDEVMDLVELRTLANAPIGVAGVSGLSTEQRKRLDARAAAIVMRTVKSVVKTGRTVVCTIHQPNMDIFQAFDELLLLKRGGETIFFGPMGDEQLRLISYFEGVEGVDRFRAGYNPANWMLDVTSPAEEAALGVNFAKIYAASDLSAEAEKRLDKACLEVDGSTDLHFDNEYPVGYWRQMRLLIQRNLTTYWRSPNCNFVRMLITIMTALVFGTLYWDIGTIGSTEQDNLNIMGCLYASTTFIAVANATIVLPVVYSETVVYYREKGARMHAPSNFAIAQGLVEIPYIIVQAIVYSLIVYWMVGFEADVVKFFWFLGFNFLNLISLTYFGMMAINLTPAPEFGAVVASFFMSIWNLTCGFTIPRPNMPDYWVWLFWINPPAYVLYGLCASQLGDITDSTITYGGLTADTEITVTVAKFMEDVWGFKHNFIGWTLFILFAFVIFFRVLSIVALTKLNWQSR
eukprot:gene3260-13284_t